MKKTIPIILMICLTLTLFSACGDKTPGTSGQNNTPDVTNSGSNSTESTKPAANQSSTSTSKIKSLDDIKKNAEAEGLAVEELHAMQQMDDAEGGFTVIIGDSYIPVYEFKNEEEAMEYAEMASNGGYNLGIINGKFVTMCSASYGVVEDDAEKDALMKIMDGTLIEMTENNSHMNLGDGTTDTKDYHEAYALLDRIINAMNETTGKMVELNNKAHPAGDPQNTDSVITGDMLLSINLAFTAYFSEDQTKLDSIVGALEYIGTEGKVTKNAANDYTITAKNNSGAALEINGVYDPATKALRMTSKEDGKVTEFFEFVPLGGDKYAFQTEGSRAIVGYKDGAVTSFTYTWKNVGEYGDAEAYDADADSIYPTGSGADEAWVAADGEDSYGSFYSFDGTVLRVNVKQMLSDERLKVEITK